VKFLATFGLLIAMVVAFVGYIASLGIRVAPPANRTSLSMDVADVNNLAVDSNVLLRGVPVGKVTRIETSISNATVHFYINSEYRVPTDSVIRLENLSALGETYIELEPRSSGGPLFRDGQRIASESVKQPSSISELAVSVVRVMNQVDPGQLQRVIGEVDTGLPDPFSVLPNLQRASLLLRNTVTDLHGRGQELLSNAQSLLKNAGFVGPALADTTPAVQAFGPTVKRTWDTTTSLSLRVDDPAVVYMFGKLLKRIQKFLDDRAPDIRMLTEPLTANMQAIAASLTTIDSSQLLTNLLASVPENGAIDLHVGIAGPGR
jgi:phospholipid/cholesterol/gamma-HCH transport system substrate-binding protein